MSGQGPNLPGPTGLKLPGKPGKPGAQGVGKPQPHPAHQLGVEKGDELYVEHNKRGPIVVRVASIGRDGFKGDCELGDRHDIPWSAVRAHRRRIMGRYTVIDQGAGGAIVADVSGKRRFLAGEMPMKEQSAPGAPATGQKGPLVPDLERLDDPVLGGLGRLRKALDEGLPVLMLKGMAGVAIKDRPGLQLQNVTDRAGHQTKRWKRTDPRRAGEGREPGGHSFQSPEERQARREAESSGRDVTPTFRDNHDTGSDESTGGGRGLGSKLPDGTRRKLFGEGAKPDGAERKPAKSPEAPAAAHAAGEKQIAEFAGKVGHVRKPEPGSETPEPHQHGDVVTFQHDNIQGSGKIVASGKDGATIQDATGREHKVRHDDILPREARDRGDGRVEGTLDPSKADRRKIGERREPTLGAGERDPAVHNGRREPAPPAAGGAATPSRNDVSTSSRDGGGGGGDGPTPPDQFDANAYASKHNDLTVTPEDILKGFPPDAAQKIAETNEKVAKLEPTDKLFKRDGKWTPERSALHQRIIDDILSDERIKAATPPEGQAPTFTVLGGRGGSGKSWFEGKVYHPDKAIVLDADAIKGKLPEYQAWNAAQVHEESGDIFDEITRQAKDLGLNIVHDATMKTGSKAVALVQGFKDAGYRAEAHYMYLPPQEAAKRAVGRFLNPDNGRFVPPGVVLGNVTNEGSFDQVKKLVDAWSFRDNNVAKGEEPRLISESTNGVDARKSGLRGQPAPARGDGDRGVGPAQEGSGGAAEKPQGQFRKSLGGSGRVTGPLLLLKAQVPHAGTADLFDAKVEVKGHTRAGKYILPHQATRRKHIEAPKGAMAVLTKPAAPPPRITREESPVTAARPGETPSPDIKHFYVSAVDPQNLSKRWLVAGPYPSHEVARAHVDHVKRHAASDPRSAFMAWGTAGSAEPRKTPLGENWAPPAETPSPAIARKPLVAKRG